MVKSSLEPIYDSDCEILEPAIETITLFDSDDEEKARTSGQIYTLQSTSNDFTVTFQNENAANKLAQPIANALKYVSGDLQFVVFSHSGEIISMEPFPPTSNNGPDKLINYKRFLNKLNMLVSTTSIYKQHGAFKRLVKIVFVILMFILFLYDANAWLYAFYVEFLNHCLVRSFVAKGLIISIMILWLPLQYMFPNKKLFLTFGIAFLTVYMYWSWILTFGIELYSFCCEFCKTLRLHWYLLVLGFIYRCIWQSKNNLLKLISLPFFNVSNCLIDILSLLIIFCTELLMRLGIVVVMGFLFVISISRSINGMPEQFSTIIIALHILFIFWADLTNFITEYDFFID